MARTKVRRTVALVVAVGVGLLLAGCGTGGSGSASGGKKLDIGFMAYDIGLDPFVSAMVEEVQKEAKAKGIHLDVRNGGNDLNKQISAVQEFVTQHKDAIIVYPGDPEGIGPAVKAADRAGIPVFTVNLSLSKNIPVTAYVGANDKDYGRFQGEMLVQAIGETGRVGLIMGALGTSAQILRTEGIKEVLSQHPGIKIVEEQPDGWQSDKTLALTQDWVNKYPQGQLDAIVVQGPEAMGSINWARKQGRDDIKWILGDYPTDLVKPIKDGTVFGTVSQDPAEQGRAVVDAAYNWLTGHKAAVQRPNLYTPLPKVTKANVDQMKPVFGL